MSLYPPIEPYATGYLSLNDGHALFWERSGNPAGQTVLFLHGGPGSGTAPRHRRYYDPEKWDIIQFDQRGSGRSKPAHSLDNNTTQTLIADMESLREELGVERWTLFGPSWGSTLAIAYAQTFPDRVACLVVEGVFLGSANEISWWHHPNGAGATKPDAFHILMQGVPDRLHKKPEAFIAWALEEMKRELASGAPCLEELNKDQPSLTRLRESLIYRWSEYEEALSWLTISEREIMTSFSEKGRDWLISHSLIEAHYFANDCFLKEPLLSQCHRLTMPVHILQSRYDLVCPPAAAYALHKAVPHSKLEILMGAGHAMTKAVFPTLVRVFDDLSRS